jgi:hypothetical protein
MQWQWVLSQLVDWLANWELSQLKALWHLERLCIVSIRILYLVNSTGR